jgi:hypothetical protein
MEETSGAVVDAAFSELVSHWLDEGDRLSAGAAAVPMPPLAPESRLRHAVQRLRPLIARHRLFVLAGMGLLPLALFLCLHRGASVQPAAFTVAAAPPITAPSAARSLPVSSAPAQASPAPAKVTLASAGSADAKPEPRRHHHHHRHHAAGARSKTVASAGRATRR